jgi:hypothetical protein
LSKTFRVEEMHQDFLDAGLTITGKRDDFLYGRGSALPELQAQPS